VPTPSSRPDWHSRGYLPHLDRPGLVQAVTFRLGDALPRALVDRWSGEPIERHWQRERTLDAGHGACWLRDPRIAELVEDALLCFDGARYRLLAWVVMPNHVHVICQAEAGHRLGAIVGGWKSYTAKAANALLKRHGEFWYADYHDRFVRDAEHLRRAVDYVHWNPVRAGLALRPRLWPYGSARRTPPLAGARA